MQPYQDPVQQPQRYSPKGAGRGAPKGQHQPKGEKDAKGKGKRGKDDAKNQSPKGKGGKRQGRPGAKAAQDWNYDNPEYPCEDCGYDEYPPEDQEQEQETGEPSEEEPYDYDYGWDGQEDQEESEPPENNESVVKTVVAVMQKYAEELAKEQQESLSLSSLALEDGDVCIKRADVLLDGGASHHVYYSPTIPEGSFKRQVELAYGTKTGYVKGSDITFIDKSVSEEQAKKPAIVSLGRLIKRGIKLEWTKTGASLVLPSKKRIVLPMKNNCPYANKEVLDIVKKIREVEERHRSTRAYYANLYSAFKARLRSQSELDEHRRQGHIH